MNHNLLVKKKSNHHHFDPQFYKLHIFGLSGDFCLSPYPGFCFCNVLVSSNDTIVKVWIGLAGQGEVFTNCDSVLPFLISQTPWNKLALIFLFHTSSRRI